MTVLDWIGDTVPDGGQTHHEMPVMLTVEEISALIDECKDAVEWKLEIEASGNGVLFDALDKLKAAIS